MFRVRPAKRFCAIAYRVLQVEEASDLPDGIPQQAFRLLRRQPHRDARLGDVAQVQVEPVLLVDVARLLAADGALQGLGQLVLQLLAAQASGLPLATLPKTFCLST